MAATTTSPRRAAVSVQEIATLTGVSVGKAHKFLSTVPGLYDLDRPHLIAAARAVLAERHSPAETVVKTVAEVSDSEPTKYLVDDNGTPKLLDGLFEVMRWAEKNYGSAIKASPVGAYIAQETTLLARQDVA